VSSHRPTVTITAAKEHSPEDQHVNRYTVIARVRVHAVNNTPEHASAAVLICSRVFLQGVGGRFQLVNQVRIKDVELVSLHNLSHAAKVVSQLLPKAWQVQKIWPKQA